MRIFLSLPLLLNLLLHSALSSGPSVRGRRWAESCPIPDCQGSKGQRGSPGPLGPQGYSGVRGPPGYCSHHTCLQFLEDSLTKLVPTNTTPTEGPEGPPGLPGQPGLPGEPGRIGPPGKDGVAGLKGDTGETGSDGVIGAPGLPGDSGAPGICEDDLCTSVEGPPGPVGPSGIPGLAGQPGSPGLRGEPGPPGMPGAAVELVPLITSEECSQVLQGLIRFDVDNKQLYYCDGEQWLCIGTDECRIVAKQFSCLSPYGDQSPGDMWYQTINTTEQGRQAADIVLVIDDSGSMSTEHEWLLTMVPALEEALLEAGVGAGTIENRYCVVAFGGFGSRESAFFLTVGGEVCFKAHQFPQARVQLYNAGQYEDGYEAMTFALDNVPFRENPFVARNMILVTDEGRREIPKGAGLNLEGMRERLRENDILLNVVVMADYELTDSPGETVLGVDSTGTSYLLHPNGEFIRSTGPLVLAEAEGNTADTYVDLATLSGGASWSLGVLRHSSLSANQSLQLSFTSALITVKLQEIVVQIDSCRKCTCVISEDGEDSNAICRVADDVTLCECVVESEGDEEECLSGSTPNEDLELENPEDPSFVGGAGGGGGGNSFLVPRAEGFSDSGDP